MSVKLADIEKIAAALPGVTTTLKWRHHTWIANERGFAWVRPLGKADIERWGDSAPLPAGDIIGIQVESLDAKDALLAMELPGFFTIQHFNNYPGLLIELRKARIKDVRAALAEAHRVALSKPPPKKRKPKPKPAKRAR